MPCTRVAMAGVLSSAGRDGELEAQVPACRLGVCEQREHVVRDVPPRVDEGIESGMHVVRVGAHEQLVDGGVRRRVVDAERDRVPRSPGRARRGG